MIEEFENKIAEVRKRYEETGWKEELEFLIKLTKRVEDLGYKIKDKLYLEDGRYIGQIVRLFTLDQAKTFFDDSKKDQYADIFLKANEAIKGGIVRGRSVNGKVVWDD